MREHICEHGCFDGDCCLCNEGEKPLSSHAVLDAGWRDKSDKDYYNEERIEIYSPAYRDKNKVMEYRIIDSQFFDMCEDASHWRKLRPPTGI